MAFGRLQAYLAQAANAVIVATANINLDFSLVKCEAPKEYQEPGKTLSKRRGTDAETGPPHVAARRLGALFEDLCPPTPKLVKAYGFRVSEIAEAAKKQSDCGSTPSIFADHAGVDGTAIWAAATSSTAALHVELLACWLARLWSGPEATSTWLELVKERRKEFVSNFDNEEEIPFSTLTASAQADISRTQLAEWDPSVRAWLRAS